MSEKEGNIFEKHVEKIFLAIILIASMYLVLTRVIFSPNIVVYDKKKFETSEIDSYISEQSKTLDYQLNRKAEPRQAYKSRFDSPIDINDPIRKGVPGDLKHGFAGLFDSVITRVDVDLFWPQPITSTSGMTEKRVFTLPVVGEVTKVNAELVRAVAYVPKAEITEQNIYSEDNSETSDLDLVTVEAEFDVSSLYESFAESFMGPVIEKQLRDPCLVKPVFAAVELQRQRLLPDGTWTGWERVSRAKIDHRKDMFQVIEDVKELPTGGMDVRLVQFNRTDVQADLLQPFPYQIASANEEWFPPTLHKDYMEEEESIRAEEKRDERQQELKEREEEKQKSRSGRTARTKTKAKQDTTFIEGGGEIGMGGGGGSSRKSRKKSSSGRKKRKAAEDKKRASSKRRAGTEQVRDFYDEYELLLIESADLSSHEGPLVFWAHDDTVQPGEKYRYRVRAGVFNPIAGTVDEYEGSDKTYDNNVVLWSQYSDVTDALDIPGKMYFFPQDVQVTAKTLTIRISKYTLGYWYSKDFTVKQGELIGQLSEYEPTEEESEADVPTEIDYATDIVLVDVAGPISDWAGGKSMRARYYFDMLYTQDGVLIERMAIKSRYWQNELIAKYNEIKGMEKETREPLRAWGGKGARRQRRGSPSGSPGGFGEMGGEMDMFLR